MDTYSQLCEALLNENATNLPIKEFVEKRKAGAKKIETQTRRKGGVATLTAIHFAAKQVPYKEAAKFVEKEEGSKLLEQKVTEILGKLKTWKKMSQREFQAITGKLEAYGEVFLQNK